MSLINRRMLLKSGFAAGGILLFQSFSLSRGILPRLAGAVGPFEVTKTEAEWRAVLTAQQYRVLREEWTEPPFKNKYHDHKEKGIYHCAGCDQALFSSRHKYDSRTGWPSFWQPMFSDAVGTKTDWKLMYPRTEVHCSRCGGHLGHIFKDGPPPTGLRYCINSAALKFVPSGGSDKREG